MRGVVLAAGLGKRMRPLTADRPKHLLPVAGKPLVRYVVEQLIRAGIGEVLIVVGYGAEKIIDALSDLRSAKISFVIQREQLGTAHALLAARDQLLDVDRFVLVYGDVFLDSSLLAELIDEASGFDGGLVAVESYEASRFGVIYERGRELLTISEKPVGIVGKALINAGIYILPSDVLTMAGLIKPSPRGEYELTDAINMLASSGRRILVKRVASDRWLDVGRPEDLLDANLRAIVGRVYVGSGVRLGCGSTLYSSSIMNNAKIGSGVRIYESLIMDGASIGRGSVIRRCVVGEGASIGDGTELLGGERPVIVSHGASLPAGSKAGPGDVI